MKPLLRDHYFRIWIVLSIVWVVAAGASRYPAINPISPYFLRHSPSAMEFLLDCNNPQSELYVWLECARISAAKRLNAVLVFAPPVALLLIGLGLRWAFRRLRSPKFSEDHDVLVALITHMAVGTEGYRTVSGLQKDLSIDAGTIQAALDSYKGLFRKSSEKPLYALHLRFARQPKDDGDVLKGTLRQELTQEDLDSLWTYVGRQADREVNRSVAFWSNSVALIVAIIALISSLVGIALSHS